MTTNLSFINSFSYKYIQLKFLAKTSVTKSLLGVHCRVKHINMVPAFKNFLQVSMYF